MLARQNDEPRPQSPTLEDEAANILALHGGDGKEAIMTLLVEMDAIADRLWIAKIAMGRVSLAAGNHDAHAADVG